MNPQTITIPANSVAPIHASGRFFLVTDLTGAFHIVTNHGDQYDFASSGSGFGDEQTPRFGTLTFYNDTAAPNTITFYVSNIPIKTPDANITSSVNVTTSTQSPVSTSSEIVPGQFVKNTTTGAGPVALANAGTFATTIILLGQKTVAHPDNGGTVNTGKVFIGFSAVNGSQPIELAPGDSFVFSVSSGRKLDLGKIYLDVLNDGDGVAVLYY